MNDELAIANMAYLADAVDGPGWYYWDSEYPEEGVVGAFSGRDECRAHAESSDYQVEEV